QPSVPTAVQAIPRSVSRGSRNRTDSSDHGECRLVAYPPRVRPDRQDHGCGDRADSWKVQQLGSRSLHEMSDLFTVLGEVLLEHRDPLRKACRFGADGCRPKSFFATTPARDRRDLRSGQRSSCIDAEVMGPYEGGEHVDAPQSVGVLLVAGTG